jgi:acetyltransferase-like isoleucine patch superfamily enzyme
MIFFRRVKKGNSKEKPLSKVVATREEVIWCYRNLLQREPESEEAIISHLDCGRSFEQVIEVFMNSSEFINRKSSFDPSILTCGNQDLPIHSLPFSNASQEKNIVKECINSLPAICFTNQQASLINGIISYPIEDKANLTKYIRIGFHGKADPSSLEGVEIELNSVCALQINISHSNTKFRMGKKSEGGWTFILFRDASIQIGDNVTCNGSVVMVDNGELVISDDCMFANAHIHVGDNHAIFDLKSGNRLNVRRAKVRFEPHVWVASHATVIGDSVIGAGSIIAANATVKGDVPRYTLVAGVPARVIKSDVCWTRSPTGWEWQDIIHDLTEKGLL